MTDGKSKDDVIEEKITLDREQPPEHDAYFEQKLRLFFGPNASHFLNIHRQQKTENGGIVAKISWISFFIPFGWFAYRKYYLASAITLVGPIALGFLIPVSAVAIGVVIALFSKHFYVLWAAKQTRRLIELKLPEEELDQRLLRSGGTSTVGMFISVVFLIGLVTAIILSAQNNQLPTCESEEAQELATEIFVETFEDAGITIGRPAISNIVETAYTEQPTVRVCEATFTEGAVSKTFTYKMDWVSIVEGRWQLELALKQ